MPTVNSPSAWRMGSGRRSSASVELNIATLAPVPNAMESTAIAVKPGFLISSRARAADPAGRCPASSM
jgi:hypothetical protein